MGDLIDCRDEGRQSAQPGSADGNDPTESNRRTVLVCRQLADDVVDVWSDREKAFRQIVLYQKGIGSLVVGEFYSIETQPDGWMRAESMPAVCPVHIIQQPPGGDNVRPLVVAQAPVFVGNQLGDAREFICYNEFFGHVLYDASFTFQRVEQFKTYMCVLKSAPTKARQCSWQVVQLLYVNQTPLRYYLLEMNVETVEKNGDVHCEHEKIRLHLRREDLREHCHEDLIPYLTVYAVAFKNQPYLPQCHMYRSCFATLVDDFTADLTKNALVPAKMARRCCDEKTKRRAMIITTLMHNEEFVHKFLPQHQSLRDRLFKFMLTGGCRRPTFNNERADLLL